MNKDGMTLMEVIIAALILALTVGGTLYIFSTEKGVVARTGRQMQAMDFARETLEELKNEIREDNWLMGTLSAGLHTPATDTFLSLADTDFGIGEKFGVSAPDIPRSYTVTNIDADTPGDGEIDYQQVTVTVEWEEPVETQ